MFRSSYVLSWKDLQWFPYGSLKIYTVLPKYILFYILAASLFLNVIHLLVNDPLCSFDTVASHNNEEICLFVNNQIARVNNAYMQRSGCLFKNKQLRLVCGTVYGLKVERYAQFICAVPTTLLVTSPLSASSLTQICHRVWQI